MREAVDSSSFASIGYEEETRTLEVEFVDGEVYRYLEVPRLRCSRSSCAPNRKARSSTRRSRMLTASAELTVTELGLAVS